MLVMTNIVALRYIIVLFVALNINNSIKNTKYKIVALEIEASKSRMKLPKEYPVLLSKNRKNIKSVKSRLAL